MVGFLWTYAIGDGFFCRAYVNWHGFFPKACTFWHGLGLAWLMPFGMCKVNIANMTLFKLYLDLKIQMAFRNWNHVLCFSRNWGEIEPSFAAKNAVGLQDLVSTKQNWGRGRSALTISQLTTNHRCVQHFGRLFRLLRQPGARAHGSLRQFSISACVQLTKKDFKTQADKPKKRENLQMKRRNFKSWSGPLLN